MWILGMGTQVLMLRQQALYPLSLFPISLLWYFLLFAELMENVTSFFISFELQNPQLLAQPWTTESIQQLNSQ